MTFDPGGFHERYRTLEQLPETLHAEVVAQSSGTLPDRVASVLALRAALLAGRLPDPVDLPWPSPEGAAVLLGVLAELKLARYCPGHPELVDAVILSILRAIDFHNRELEDALIRLRSEIEGAAEADLADRTQRARTSPEGIEVERKLRLREVRSRAIAYAKDATIAALRSEWMERVAAWSAIIELFGSLGALLERGWDLSRSVLKHVGWRDVIRAHELLKGAPRLQDVIRTLGRLHEEASGTATVAERILEPVRRAAEELRDVRSPLVFSETRGVERSSELSRMLPAEVVLLGHPRLRMLWHARFAERALLTYRVEGVIPEQVVVDTDYGRAPAKKEVPRGRGPILLCIDTSGSMCGAPENVAKAIALEAMRVAHAEKRACHVYTFSGPRDVAEHTLSLTDDGLTTLLAFLGQSFGGGTDILEPVRRATTKLEEAGWERADLLMVTDGQFLVPDDSIRQIESARQRHGLRVHLVLIGGGGKWTLDRLCDHIHLFDRADLAVAETPASTGDATPRKGPPGGVGTSR